MQKQFVVIGICLGAFFLLTQYGCSQRQEGTMKISSPAFAHNGMIPKKYTCQGDDMNPALMIPEIPEGTKSLALIVDDPDAPMGTWVHWIVFNIPLIHQIDENSVPGTLGYNDFGRNAWDGPCPPSGTHRYFFKIYALDTVLSVEEGAMKEEIEDAMQEHILDQGQLIGRYRRTF